MLEELLKIICEADKLMSEHQAFYQSEKLQLIASGFEELKEIDNKIHQHFKDQTSR